MNAAASHSTIYKAVLNGSMKSILDEVKAGLAQGMEPGMIVSDELIPAINEVGDLFEQQKYFLPQLIASAETMKKAIEYLEPMLSSGDETGPKVTNCDCYRRRRYSRYRKKSGGTHAEKLWISCSGSGKRCTERRHRAGSHR